MRATRHLMISQAGPIQIEKNHRSIRLKYRGEILYSFAEASIPAKVCLLKDLSVKYSI